MDLTSIGTISGYVRELDSRRRAEQRNQGRAQDRKPSTAAEWVKQQEELAKSPDRQELTWGDTGDQKLTGIQTKYYSGGTLTKSEREYLKSKNPMLYERLLAAESAKKSYRQELKRCRTREEVHRLKMSHTAGAVSAIKAGSAEASDRLNGVQSSTNEFVRSGEYHSLPTEHEKAVAEKRVKQAEERQRRKLAEKSGESGAEQQKTESSRKKLFHDIRPGETVEQAKNSPEMLKVRRAKAKRAYSSSAGDFKVVIKEKA